MDKWKHIEKEAISAYDSVMFAAKRAERAIYAGDERTYQACRRQLDSEMDRFHRLVVKVASLRDGVPTPIEKHLAKKNRG